MKTTKLLIPMMLMLILLSFNFMSDKNLILSYKKIDGNSVSTYFQNTGIFNRNFEIARAGFEWPAGSGMYLRNTSNIAIAALVGNDTIISAEGEFQPGYIDDSGNPQGIDDPAYRVYKIVNGDTTSQDYLHWPANQGAYVRNDGKPFLIGEQTLFSSYTDGYTNTTPMKAQVLETDWVFNLNGPLANVVFSEFRIINRSANVWNNFYAGIYTDDDIGMATDDRSAPDSSLNIAYTYNLTNNDGIYGMAPPAVSFNFLSGAILFTGNNNDSTVFYRPVTSNNRIVKRGYKNLYLSSFNPILNGNSYIGFPRTDPEYYRMLEGLRREGGIWINPITNLPTKFPDINFGEGDYHFIVSSGPATVNPGDTQTIIIAQLAARGTNNLQSVSVLKTGSSFIRNLYENNFGTVSVNEPGISELPENYKLYQNYPNPFNPRTNISYELISSEYVILKIYDIGGKEIKTLVNGIQPSGKHTVTFEGSSYSSGIYFYKLTAGKFSETKKMILSK